MDAVTCGIACQAINVLKADGISDLFARVWTGSLTFISIVPVCKTTL